MKIKRIGVDLAKNVYQLHGVDVQEQCVLHRRLKRDKWLEVLFEKTEPVCEIGMEACTGSHHWARVLESRGYTVKLIAHGDTALVGGWGQWFNGPIPGLVEWAMG